MQKIFIVAIILGVLYPIISSAAMSSTNYYIYSDSIGLDGGSLSTSTSYTLQDTVADPVAGIVTSTSYEMRGGYQAMDQGSLSLSVSNASLNLGTLSATAVSSASTIATVSSDATTGYTLAISTVAGSMIQPVVGGSVVAGTEGYGLAASGSDSLVSGDVPVTAGLQLASFGSQASGHDTTLTFKAAMSIASGANTYNQSITLVASANF